MCQLNVVRSICLMLMSAACIALMALSGGTAAAAPGVPAAASFAGEFADAQLKVVLSESGGGYTGTITLNGKSYPAKAASKGEGIAGRFEVDATAFAFTATLAGDRMTLVSGVTTYQLNRAVMVPVDTEAKFGAFTVLGATANGKTLFMKLPAGQTLEVAITLTADELGKVLDAKPGIEGAFADAQSKNKGGASLTGKLKGKDVQGLIFCSVGAGGGSTTVVLAAAGASKPELATLMRFLPTQLKMRTHKFPDGSGSVGLPDGWTTANSSAAHGVAVNGPAGQLVVFSNIQNISEPNCRLVQAAQQNDRMAQQNYETAMRMYERSVAMHQRFPNTQMPKEPQKPVVASPDPNVRFAPLRFCDFCDGPEAVLKVWYPLSEEIGKRGVGGAYSSLDKVIEIFPGEPNPLLAGSKSGTVYLAVSDHIGEKVMHMRALNLVSTCETTKGESWQLAMCVMRAPDATFDADLPTMNAILNSVKLDMNVVNGEIKAEGDAVRKMGEQMTQQILKRGQDFQDEQAARFNAQQRQIAARQQAMHDSTSDFIEYIGGVRTVCDQKTGQSGTVNLFNSTAIVNGMNAAVNDPGRFVPIPLRYQR